MTAGSEGHLLVGAQRAVPLLFVPDGLELILQAQVAPNRVRFGCGASLRPVGDACITSTAGCSPARTGASTQVDARLKALKVRLESLKFAPMPLHPRSCRVQLRENVRNVSTLRLVIHGVCHKAEMHTLHPRAVAFLENWSIIYFQSISFNFKEGKKPC